MKSKMVLQNNSSRDMNDVSNPKSNLTDDVINTSIEFKISEPQAYGFAIILNYLRKEGRNTFTAITIM
jgi:hypothetical protein